MRKFTGLLTVVVAAVVLLLAVPAGADAQKSTKKKTLATFRLMDADGTEVELDSDQLKGKKLAICFLSTWSEMSVRQAKAVAAAAAEAQFAGRVLLVCGGPERQVRGLRVTMPIDGALWLKAGGTMASDFRDAFDPASNVDRVPALLIVDEARSVLHSSVGELGKAELAEAFKAK